MSSMLRANYDKDVAFVDLFMKVHPNYKDRPFHEQELIRTMAENGELNTEMMTESMLPLINPKLIRTNQDGMDYVSSDPLLNMSDSKTSTCARRDNPQNGVVYDVYNGSICGVDNKLGALLVMIYNEYTKKIDFFHIPHKAYSGFDGKYRPYRVHVKAKCKGTISYSYSRRNDTYSNNLEYWRCSTLEEMLLLDGEESDWV